MSVEPGFLLFLPPHNFIWACSAVGSAKGSVFCHIYNFILLYSSVPLLELLIWAYNSAGSAKGSVFCLIYNFISLYSSVPLLELLIWARSSVWESKGDITRAQALQQIAQSKWVRFIQTKQRRARSSVGRAFGSHPRGRGFESLRVHHKKP